jgi:protein tyrosine phosphatase (PTP) superfamily phosphohydrolase (DUF442 family)
MKTRLLSLTMLVMAFSIHAQEKNSVVEIEAYDALYKYNNYYLGAQPSLEQLEYLYEKGVRKIVNLRTEGENENFTESSYNEEKWAAKLGFEYVSIPVDGYSDFTPEKLADFTNSVHTDDPVLIHCAGAGRVTHFFMAYLVQEKGYSLDEAVEIGKSLKFKLPIEKLLDTDIRCKL